MNKSKLTIVAALLLSGILVVKAQGYIDTSQGLYFMSLLPTLGLSENQAIAAFTSFRPATEAEIGQLWSDCGIPQVGGLFEGVPISDLTAMTSLNKVMAALGSTGQQSGYQEMFGLTASHSEAGFDFQYINGIGYYGVTPNPNEASYYNPNIVFNGIGTFMVQSIPEPSVMLLLLVAMVPILVSRIRDLLMR